MSPLPKIWNWSPAAVKAFFAGAARGKRRFNAPAGMDAALLEDLPRLVPAMTRFWVQMLTNPEQTAPRETTIRARAGTFETDAAGNVTVRMPLTREFLIDILALPDVDSGGGGEEEPDGDPAMPTDPVPDLDGSKEEALPTPTPEEEPCVSGMPASTTLRLLK